MSTVTAAARRLSAAAVLLAAVGGLLLSLAVRTDVLRVSRVLTGSMAPAVPAGAAVLSRPADAGAIEVGDLVMFLPPEPFGTGGTPVAHRVVEVELAGGDVLVRTKGDANAAVDPWTLNASRSTVQQVAWSSLTVGRAADVVARGGGSLLVSVVVALVTVRILALLWKPPGRRQRGRGVDWLRDAATQ